MIEIVRPNPSHAPIMKTFFSAINVKDITRHFSPHEFTTEYAEYICNYNGLDEYYILIFDDLVIGYGMLRGWDEGYTIPSLGLCMLPGYNGKGLCHNLIIHMMSVAKMRGCDEVMMKVDKDNLSSIILCHKVGFHYSEHDERYYRGRLKLRT